MRSITARPNWATVAEPRSETSSSRARTTAASGWCTAVGEERRPSAVTHIRRDGSFLVKRLGATGGRTVLPSEYVTENVDLGYAVTVHRAQGVTVDTAHIVATASTTRENLYDSMTRGRESNIVHVALDQAHLLSRSGLTADQHAAVVQSAAFGPLTTALRRAEAYHHGLDAWCRESSRDTVSTTPTTLQRSSATEWTSSRRPCHGGSAPD